MTRNEEKRRKPEKSGNRKHGDGLRECSAEMEDIRCFEPVFDERSEILVLGSFPSVRSRADGFYYAHPRNAFWIIIGQLFCPGERLDDVEGKKTVLLKNRIALWDVCKTCEIRKSADSTIRKAVYNDIAGLIGKTIIRSILFNGATAEKLFMKYIKDTGTGINLPFARLPSTSPANAIPSEAKLQAWKQALTHTEKGAE